MSTLELKNMLIEEIAETNDEELLKALLVIIGLKKNQSDIYVVNEEQEKQIDLALQDIRDGRTTDMDDVFKEIDAWLK
jgi:hypothetical protein